MTTYYVVTRDLMGVGKREFEDIPDLQQAREAARTWSLGTGWASVEVWVQRGPIPTGECVAVYQHGELVKEVGSVTDQAIITLANELTALEESYLRLAADFLARSATMPSYGDYILVPADPDHRTAVLTLVNLGLLAERAVTGREAYRLTDRGAAVVAVVQAGEKVVEA